MTVSQQPGYLVVDVLGVRAQVFAVDAASIARRVDDGLLVISRLDFNDPNVALSRRPAILPSEETDRRRETIEAALREGLGLAYPLVWNVRGTSDLLDEASFASRTLFTDLATAVEHEALLAVLADPSHRDRMAGQRFMVLVFGQQEPSTERRLHVELDETTVTDIEQFRPLTDRFVELCDATPASHIEFMNSHVPTRSAKITSIVQLTSAVKEFWPFGPAAAAEVEPSARFLAEFWECLAEGRSELQPSFSADRSRLRSASLATSSLGIHAYVAVGAHLYKRYGRWTQNAATELQRSPLARTVSIGSSLDNAARFFDEVSFPGPNAQQVQSDHQDRSAAGSEDRIRRHIHREIARALDETDPLLLEFALRMYAPGDPQARVRQSEFRSTLAGAVDIFERRRTRHDLMDADVPWWWLGMVVGYAPDRSGTGYRRAQAKSTTAKRWVGQLAVDLIDRDRA